MDNDAKSKTFKDPIYGYIEIDDCLIKNVIDTPAFQRLRNIIQTSYTPLYSTALHNRFTHSLGVYHLGKIAFQSIEKNFIKHNKYKDKENDINEITKNKDDFLLACLLHDVGHAPFSHIGEKFFCKSNEKHELLKELYSLLEGEAFKIDLEKSIKKAANHEFMSAIVALKTFAKIINSEKFIKDKEFFARCITGYLYSNKQDIRNCLISLLNSSVIDVDRLDYIIRDSFVSGYQNVSIDYVRLLNGLIAVYDNKEYKLVYHKSAMSVIEHVIFAHDSERKWLQNHPVILYENSLVEYCIHKVEQYFSRISKSLQESERHDIFCSDSLTEKGIKYNGEQKISLFADEDIIYHIKNIDNCNDKITNEYFNRGLRRHPLWKSEAEYVHLLNMYIVRVNWEKILSIFSFIYYKVYNLGCIQMIDRIMLSNCKKELETIKDIPVDSQKDEREKKDRISILSVYEKYLNCFEKFAEENGLEFDFFIVLANEFKSTFSKIDINKLQIWFPDSQKSTPMKDIIPSLTSTSSSYGQSYKDGSGFFYFYYKIKLETKIDQDTKRNIQKNFWEKLCKELIEIFDTLS